MTGSQDHPRVCGKNVALVSAAQSVPGSPPRVREKPFLNVSDGRNGGITPACAGKTNDFLDREQLTRDHPRVCGKNANKRLTSECNSGSPPRVREKLGNVIKSAGSSRITPACAGKTYKSDYHARECGDHPRVCGKNHTTRL